MTRPRTIQRNMIIGLNLVDQDNILEKPGEKRLKSETGDLNQLSLTWFSPDVLNYTCHWPHCWDE